MFHLNSKSTMAAAAAMLALSSVSFSTPAAAGDQGGSASATARCYGVNSCKGASDCKSGSHDCKGQNSCKGQGFKDLTAGQRAAEHGSTTPPAP